MKGITESMLKTRDILARLGFKENPTAMTDNPPGYVYDFGNLQIEGVEVYSLSGSVWKFSGVLTERRTLAVINFEVPLQVENYEQGVALIAYGLGSNFVPRGACDWLDQGRDWSHFLPWNMEHEKYQQRPQCQVERDMLRPISVKLREYAQDATADDIVLISFDGEILRFAFKQQKLVVQAEGGSWNESYQVLLSSFDFLPKRIMMPHVGISIWNGHLHIGKRMYPLLTNYDGISATTAEKHEA